MTRLSWRKSSFCQEGEACVYVAAAPGGPVRVAGSADPGEAFLTLAPAAWTAFLRTLA